MNAQYPPVCTVHTQLVLICIVLKQIAWFVDVYSQLAWFVAVKIRVGQCHCSVCTVMHSWTGSLRCICCWNYYMNVTIQSSLNILHNNYRTRGPFLLHPLPASIFYLLV